MHTLGLLSYLMVEELGMNENPAYLSDESGASWPVLGSFVGSLSCRGAFLDS